jgi:hypothetical protein
VKTVTPDEIYSSAFIIKMEINNHSLDYKFHIDKDCLYISHLYGFIASQNIKHTIRDVLKAEIQPEEITDELYIGSLQGDYKFVRRQTSGEYYFLHHYVKRYLPELYDKYRLLGDGNYDTIAIEPRLKPIYIKE